MSNFLVAGHYYCWACHKAMIKIPFDDSDKDHDYYSCINEQCPSYLGNDVCKIKKLGKEERE